jgi:hypothetical protein
MTDSILTLRFTRRAIGAAAIRGGELSLLDGRFLTGSTRERSIAGALRYIDKLLELTRPTVVALDSPSAEPSTLAGALRSEVERRLLAENVPVLTLNRQELLAAFGVTRVIDRRQLRELIDILWPDLERVKGKVRPYVADAAAGALYGECQVAFGGVGP